VVEAYRPIALLNTTGKILESIVISRLNIFVEKYQLLLDVQIGARPERFITSILELLTEQIHTIWKYEDNNDRCDGIRALSRSDPDPYIAY
jgi:hypothetical protein